MVSIQKRKRTKNQLESQKKRSDNSNLKRKKIREHRKAYDAAYNSKKRKTTISHETKPVNVETNGNSNGHLNESTVQRLLQLPLSSSSIQIGQNPIEYKMDESILSLGIKTEFNLRKRLKRNNLCNSASLSVENDEENSISNDTAGKHRSRTAKKAKKMYLRQRRLNQKPTASSGQNSKSEPITVLTSEATPELLKKYKANMKEKRLLRKRNTYLDQNMLCTFDDSDPFKNLQWSNRVIRRFTKFVKDNRHQFPKKDYTRILRNIPSKVRKYWQIGRLIIGRIKRYIIALARKVANIEGNLMNSSSDEIQCNNLLQCLYGNERIHSANAENYGVDLDPANYCSINQDSITNAVGDCLNDILDKIDELNLDGNNDSSDATNCNTKSNWKKGKQRSCYCDLPLNWAINVHNALKKLTEGIDIAESNYGEDRPFRTVLDFRAVMQKYGDFEFCPGCLHSNNNLCCNCDNCQDMLNFINKMSCHFTGLRTLKRQLYYLRQAVNWIIITDCAILKPDYKSFLAMVNDLNKWPRQVQKIFETEQQTSDAPTEEEIEAKYGHLFDSFYRKMNDFPDKICSICQLWCKKPAIFNDLDYLPGYHEHATTLMIINDVLEYSDMPIQVCHEECLKHLKEGTIPPLSRKNNMWVDELPPELSRLNLIELNLIRIGRAFHNIIKLQPCRINTGGPRDFIDAIKGYTFHFPTPVSATTNYLVETLPSEQSLNILVDCLPTKKHIVWRSIVNVDNLFSALTKLKEINHLYENVTINRAFPFGAGNNLPIIFDKNSQNIFQTDSKNGDIVNANNDSTTNINNDQSCYQTDSENPVCSYTCGDNSNNDSATNANNDFCAANSVAGNENSNVQPVVSKNISRHLLCNKAYLAKKIVLTESMLRKSINCEPYDGVTIELLSSNAEIDPNVTDVEIYRTQKVQLPNIYSTDPMLDVMCFVELFPTGKYGLNMKRNAKITASKFVKSKLKHMNSRFRKNKAYLFTELSRHDERAINSGIYSLMNMRNNKNISVGQLKKQVQEKNPQLESNLSVMFSHVRGLHEYWNHQKNNLRAMIDKFGPATFFLTLSPAEYNWDDMKNFLLLRNGAEFEGKRQAWMCCHDPVSVAVQFRRRFESFLKEILLSYDGPLGIVEHYYGRVEYQSRGAPHVHMLLWIKDAPLLGQNSEEEIRNYIDERITCALPSKITSPDIYSLVLKYQIHKCSSCYRSFTTHKSGLKSYRCRFGFPRVPSVQTVIHGLKTSLQSRTTNSFRVKKTYELKRKNNERKINDYNSAILKAWRGNMDIQYVGEDSTLITRYVTKYIIKAEKSISEEFYSTLDQNRSQFANLHWIGRQRLKNRETGAYECADKLNSQPFFYSSDACKFINTVAPEKRKRCLKRYTDIAEMDDESSNVFFDSIYEKYAARPDELEEISLYEFCSWWELKKAAPKSKEFYKLKLGQWFIYKRKSELVVVTNYFSLKTAESIEAYFQSLLILHVAWRNEEQIKNENETYQQAFERYSLTIQKLGTTVEKRKLLEQAWLLVKQIEDEERNNLQAAEKFVIDQKDEEIVRVDLMTYDEDYIPSSVIPDELSGSSLPCNNDPIEIEHRVPMGQDGLKQRLNAMNAGQKDIYNYVVQKIAAQKMNTDKEPIRMAVSGVAGTGKSFLIEVLADVVQHEYGTANEPVVILLAPTGIAAFNISGTTLHRSFKLPINQNKRLIKPYQAFNRAEAKELRTIFDKVQLIIIDEFSMVSNITFGMIYLRLDECFGGKKFGDKNILLFGDLLQLAPVKAPYIFEQITPAMSRLHFQNLGFGFTPLWPLFDYKELTENMRQKDDLFYANILDRVRIGCPNQEDIDSLKSRLIELNFAINDSKEMRYKKIADYYQNVILSKYSKAICLLSLNEDVDAFNRAMLIAQKINAISIVAIDRGGNSVTVKKKPKSGKKDASITAGLDESLSIGIGARVMLRRNINVELGLVNGVIGTIIDFIYRKNFIYAILVKFDNICEQTEIERSSADFEVMPGIIATRRQFPLCLAYAITIHKSQGLTLEAILADVGDSIFEKSMAYVALSRVRSLDNLFLIAFEKRKLVCRDLVMKEYNRLRISINLEPFKKFNTSVLPFKSAESRSKDVNISLVKSLLNEMHHTKTDNAPFSEQQTPIYLRLTNYDGVSCYCNVIVQALLRLSNFIAEISQFENSDPICASLMSLATHDDFYTTRDTMALRRSVGSNFEASRQQDAHEFFLQLLKRINRDEISSLFGYGAIYHLRCGYCAHKSCNNNELVCSETLLSPSNFNTEIICKSGQTFMELFEKSSPRLKRCEACNREEYHKVDIELQLHRNNKYLCVMLPRFATDTRKEYENRKITNFVANKVVFCQQKFQTIAAVIYKAKTSESGHYTVMVKHEQNKWISIDDLKNYSNDVRQRFVCNLKDVNLLFLEKC